MLHDFLVEVLEICTYTLIISTEFLPDLMIYNNRLGKKLKSFQIKSQSSFYLTLCVCVYVFVFGAIFLVIQPAYVHNEQAMHINLWKGKKILFLWRHNCCNNHFIFNFFKNWGVGNGKFYLNWKIQKFNQIKSISIRFFWVVQGR